MWLSITKTDWICRSIRRNLATFRNWTDFIVEFQPFMSQNNQLTDVWESTVCSIAFFHKGNFLLYTHCLIFMTTKSKWSDAVSNLFITTTVFQTCILKIHWKLYKYTRAWGITHKTTYIESIFRVCLSNLIVTKICRANCVSSIGRIDNFLQTEGNRICLMNVFFRLFLFVFRVKKKKSIRKNNSALILNARVWINNSTTPYTYNVKRYDKLLSNKLNVFKSNQLFAKLSVHTSFMLLSLFRLELNVFRFLHIYTVLLIVIKTKHK